MTSGASRRAALGRVAAVAVLGLAAPLAATAGRGTLKLYRANGRYAGRVEANGRHYDAQGRYVGRVEGQRLYDAQGRFIGRYEASGMLHDATDEVAVPQAPPASAPRPRLDLIRILPDPAASAPRPSR